MRNPEFQFIGTDADAVVASLTAAYEAVTGFSVSPGGPEGLFIRWVADVIVHERVLNNYTANQNLPSRAEGGNLDELAQLFAGLERPAAKPAVSTQRFHISAPQMTSVPVPRGTRVTDTGGSLVWETAVGAVIPIGSVSADVPVRCQTPGVIGNGFALGQINTLIDLDNVRFFLLTENVTVSGAGADAASDGEYYELLRLSMDSFSTAGARGAYIYHAKNVSTEIADVVPVSPVPGHVVLYVLMKDGTAAGTEIKNAVLAACGGESVRPLTDFVSAADPETVRYDIDFTFFIPSRSPLSSADAETAVRAAVDGYIQWQCGRLGRDVNPDELRRRVMETGVKRIVLNQPAFTVLRDGGNGAVPQLAAAGNVNVINGGYEDE
jgi:phage-related baseplate assembly protein